MKLNTELSHDAEYIGDIQENRVGIDKSNLDFITTLLTSNLYSKPLESFLRETVANAYDSHMEAGTNEHILLLIEDSGYKSYTISIRDYGVGVSPERFEKIYRNIGSSTKRDSNDYIGMFGIGRFSCLSCADVANITSYYEGKKYSYIMYKNGGGINIDKMSETEGDFKNGLEVSIKKTIYSNSEWREAITHLCLFDKLYITYKGENYYLKNLVGQFNERKITSFKSFSRCSLLSNSDNYFRVGNVLYSEKGNLTELATKNGLVIDLPIGSVDITPNREALQYTDYTNRTIKSRVLEVKKELEVLVNSVFHGDITMSDFYKQFCDGSYYKITVSGEEFSIDKEDVEIDSSSLTIGGSPIPEGYDKFLSEVKYIGIDKDFIHKGINKSMYGGRRPIDTSIKNLLLGNYRLVDKMDKVTKQVTWLYFTDHVTRTSVVLTYEGLDSFKNSVADYARRNLSIGAEASVIDEYVKFLFSHITVDTMSNDDVPSDYIEAYREEQRSKRKKVDATKVPIRVYSSESYQQDYLNELPKGGLVIYSTHTRNDEVLKDIANVTSYISGICKVITLKAEYLPLLAHNRRFMTLESFMFLRNKALSKYVTAKIILTNFNKMLSKYETRSVAYPIWREFLKKYHQEKKAIEYGRCCHTSTVSDIIDYYTSKGWVNQTDIQYFSLSEEDMRTASVWDRMKEFRSDIVQMLALKQFGKNTKIGLVPVKIPKLTYIEEKQKDESI